MKPAKNKLMWRDIDSNAVEIITSYNDCKEQMCNVFPSIEKERLEVRKTLMIILTNPIYLRDDNCFIFPVKILRHLGINPNTFNKILAKYPFFVRKSGYYSKARKEAIKYDSTEYYEQFLNNMHMTREELNRRVILALTDEKRINIAEEELPNYRIRADYSINDIDINIDNVNTLIPHLSDMNQLTAKILLNNYKGRYEVYKHYDCGRYFSTLGVSFQNVDRRIRYAAFSGMYNYDFNNCHYKVMEQFLPDDPVLKRYNADPKGEQKRIQELYGVDKYSSKRLFLSIMYGASSIYRKDHAWTDWWDEETVKSVLHDDFVQDMMKLRGRLRKVIEKTDIVEKRAPKNLLTDIAFLYENEMLMILASYCKPQILLFDGLITKDSVNTKEVEKEILNKLGVEIKLAEEIIDGENI